jgi:hypothetical protein
MAADDEAEGCDLTKIIGAHFSVLPTNLESGEGNENMGT